VGATEMRVVQFRVVLAEPLHPAQHRERQPGKLSLGQLSPRCRVERRRRWIALLLCEQKVVQPQMGTAQRVVRREQESVGTREIH